MKSVMTTARRWNSEIKCLLGDKNLTAMFWVPSNAERDNRPTLPELQGLKSNLDIR